MIEPFVNIAEHLKYSILDPITMGAVISGGSALLKGIGGLFQSGKAKRMLKRTQDPGYKIPSGFYENLAQSEQLARTGMPMEQYNLARQNIDRSMASGTRALSRSSNPSAGVASMVRAGIEGGLNLDSANASIRRQNILQAMGARRELAGQQLSKQQYAQQRYMDQVNQANALRGAGMQNISGALSNVGNIGMGLIGSGMPGSGSQTMGQSFGLPTIPRATGTGINFSGGAVSTTPIVKFP